MPDTWITPRVWVAGEKYTASKANDISNNLRVLFPYTAGGDVSYRNPAGAYLTRLAKPSVDSLLKNTSVGVPSWLAVAAIPGLLHAKATANYDAGDQSITSTSYVDITNATVNIVTTRTCTIRMIATGTIAVGSNAQRALVQGVIGGVGSGDNGAPHTSSAFYNPFTLVFYRTGVGAGTITCKLQGRANAGGNTGFFERGRITVEAFVE